MKRIVLIAAVVLATAGIAGAADNLVLPAKPGDVKFPHKQHQDKLNSCQPCHSTDAGGKIAGFGKESAHKLCKDCHVDKKSGPTTCSGCHKQP